MNIYEIQYVSWYQKDFANYVYNIAMKVRSRSLKHYPKYKTVNCKDITEIVGSHFSGS